MAANLLRGPDGPFYDQAVLALYRYLIRRGADGVNELRDAFRPTVLQALIETAAECWDIDEIPLAAYAASQYWTWRFRWMTDCRSVDRADSSAFFSLLWEALALPVSLNRDAVDNIFCRIGDIIIREDGTLLEDGLRVLEIKLTLWLEDTLRPYDAEYLSPSGKRAMALSRHLYSPPFGHSQDLSLHLVACHKGRLFFLTPEAVHTLEGEEGETFLKRELDRLKRMLPLADFNLLLQEMIWATPQGGSPAAEILASYTPLI